MGDAVSISEIDGKPSYEIDAFPSSLINSNVYLS
jgi:hypothetical protein